MPLRLAGNGVRCGPLTLHLVASAIASTLTVEWRRPRLHRYKRKYEPQPVYDALEPISGSLTAGIDPICVV